MEYKLEITKKLEDLAAQGILDSSIAILNLPTLNLCEKRAERIELRGRLVQPCDGCVTQKVKLGKRMSQDQVKEIIDHFVVSYGTRFITINGRGDPFHPKLKEETLGKIVYAHDAHGMQSYIFTAGQNLDEEVCSILARYGANTIVSLFGNPFIDVDFFEGREYPISKPPLQNQALIAGNLRRLIDAYRDSENQPEEGTTRVGMSYVVSERDLDDDCAKIKRLKQAANANGIFFNVNTNFNPHPNIEIQRRLKKESREYTDFHLAFTTTVDGYCQMGAGSGATVDHDGTLLRCPYMNNSQGDSNFFTEPEACVEILQRYMRERTYPCVLRTHEI